MGLALIKTAYLLKSLHKHGYVGNGNSWNIYYFYSRLVVSHAGNVSGQDRHPHLFLLPLITQIISECYCGNHTGLSLFLLLLQSASQESHFHWRLLTLHPSQFLILIEHNKASVLGQQIVLHFPKLIIWAMGELDNKAAAVPLLNCHASDYQFITILLVRWTSWPCKSSCWITVSDSSGLFVKGSMK